MENLVNKYNSEKVTLSNEKLDRLINLISANDGIALNLNEEIKNVRLKRNKTITEKLNKFKKVDDKGNNSFYLYPKELKDLFCILFEVHDFNESKK